MVLACVFDHMGLFGIFNFGAADAILSADHVSKCDFDFDDFSDLSGVYYLFHVADAQ